MVLGATPVAILSGEPGPAGGTNRPTFSSGTAVALPHSANQIPESSRTEPRLISGFREGSRDQSATGRPNATARMR